MQLNVLRNALGPDGDLIKAIPGRGYKMLDALPDILVWNNAPRVRKIRPHTAATPKGVCRDARSPHRGQQQSFGQSRL
jgi:DNA-binding winged helix-turn-helix (wHTH) protein